MTHFLLLNTLIELTEIYGGVAKEDGCFILEQILLLLSSSLLQRQTQAGKVMKFFRFSLSEKQCYRVRAGSERGCAVLWHPDSTAQ